MVSPAPNGAPAAGLDAAGFGQAARSRSASAEALNAQAWTASASGRGGDRHRGLGQSHKPSYLRRPDSGQ